MLFVAQYQSRHGKVLKIAQKAKMLKKLNFTQSQAERNPSLKDSVSNIEFSVNDGPQISFLYMYNTIGSSQLGRTHGSHGMTNCTVIEMREYCLDKTSGLEINRLLHNWIYLRGKRAQVPNWVKLSFWWILKDEYHKRSQISGGEIYLSAELTSWTFQWDLTL